jgi:uncharacterized Zn-binding protein involved in type VI secretion
MPAVHRNNDARACGAKTKSQGQKTVYIGGERVAVKGDPNTHGKGNLKASINPGTVFINGLPMVVVGSDAEPDDYCPISGAPHCNPKATGGASDVFAF